MKLLTMYLPQFHRVKENDQWWGEGFTEWTAVKNAVPLFEGHDQPKVPYHDNYYDLLNKGTMQWQAELMKEYGVYGQVFYHYWFADGRRILEKPAENLLRWKEIDMPFCFSWANESWARSWSNLSDKNTWSSKLDTEIEMDSSNGVLLEQAYGEEKAWREHFEYLLQFFVDERYIKKDGKPIFIIYKPDSIPCLARMIDYWREMSGAAKLPGIYVIGTNSERRGILDATLMQEPQASIRNAANKKMIDGHELWRQILQREVSANTFLCGFSGYDDTPRRGEGGKVVEPIEPKEFREYMKQLLAKSRALGNEFTFINAWNEWGEGMYLEPDQTHEFQMLKAIRQAMEEYQHIDFRVNKVATGDAAVIGRYKSYWNILDKWLTLLENGKSLEEILSKRGFYTIALYGLGMLGLHVMKELEGSKISIKYGIDQRGSDIRQAFPILKKEDELPEVDAVIVSATYDFGEIYRMLNEKMDCPIISLEEIVGEGI